MFNSQLIADLIVTPQGAEYQAVKNALKSIKQITPQILPLPIGIDVVSRFLVESEVIKSLYSQQQPRIILLGLCGSLDQKYQISQGVIYQNCVYMSNTGNLQSLECDRNLTQICQQRLQINSNLVTGLTSDRVISSAISKRELGEKYQTQVVDMEGFGILNTLYNLNPQIKPAIAMIRVISDDCFHNIPDLSNAIAVNGSLNPLILANIFLHHPIGAMRLIKGSLQGLNTLQNITKLLFSY